MQDKNMTAKRLTFSILTLIVLLICLCITTYAAVLAMIGVDNHYFRTGTVQINLNDGKPVITEHEFLFEPGMTVKKDFFVENESTGPIYYRVYFENVQGGLADVLEVAIKDGDTVLCSGTAAELTQKNVTPAEDQLKAGELRVLTAWFHFPEEMGNSTQNLTLSFDIRADAVQTKNNPDKLFE